MSKSLISRHIGTSRAEEPSLRIFILKLDSESSCTNFLKYFGAPYPQSKQLHHRIHGLWWVQFSKVPTSSVFWGRRCREAGEILQKERSSGEPNRRNIFSHSQKALIGLTITAFLQTDRRNYTPAFAQPWGKAWNTAPHLIYWAVILWRDKKMSFLVIYVSNSESTSTGFSSQRDFIFVGTFQGQRLQFPNFTQEKKSKRD